MRTSICGRRLHDGSRCPALTTGGRYCDTHQPFAARFRQGTRPPVRDLRAWRRVRAALLEAWVAEHGWVCPGHGRPTHPSRDLTADHRVPLVQGGAPLDPANLAVLCRACNSRKSMRDRQP